MGLYEDQLAKIATTEEFLQRQIDLSDPNKADVIDALLNNTWGTTNTFEIDGRIIENPSNLEEYLIQEGFERDLITGSIIIPEYVDSSIFSPVKYDLTRYISSLVPIGGGLDLGGISRSAICTCDQPCGGIPDCSSKPIYGEMPTINKGTTEDTNQRDINPIQEDEGADPITTIENDPLLTSDQKGATLAVFLMIASGAF